MKSIGIIPCRYGSQRFPGKPLADLQGKPMMWHVYQQAQKCPLLQEIYVATDDARIEEACKGLDMKVLMTGDEHFTGTDRTAECAEQIDADIYVNIQGDEPLIEPSAITAVTQTLIDCHDPAVMASNAYVPFGNTADVIDNNNVKVVLSAQSRALFYSRLPIPYPKGGPTVYLRQLGLYAFRKSGLQLFAEHSPGPIERAEGVEMLRFLEYGYDVQMVEVDDDSIPVDTEADLERVRNMMAERP